MGYGSARAFQAIGAGFRGIGATVAGTRERRAADELQAAERARLAEQEAYQREQDALELAKWSAERGGGLGPRPDAPSLGFDTEGIGMAQGMERTSPLSPFVPPPPVSLAPTPPEPGIVSKAMASPDAGRYMSGGTPARPFHVERPDYRRKLDREQALADEEATYRRDTSRLAPFIGEERAGAAVAGVPWSVLAPPPPKPETPVNWERVVDESGEIIQIHPRSGEIRRTGVKAKGSDDIRTGIREADGRIGLYDLATGELIRDLGAGRPAASNDNERLAGLLAEGLGIDLGGESTPPPLGGRGAPPLGPGARVPFDKGRASEILEAIRAEHSDWSEEQVIAEMRRRMGG